jgi:hypothetical protein
MSTRIAWLHKPVRTKIVQLDQIRKVTERVVNFHDIWRIGAGWAPVNRRHDLNMPNSVTLGIILRVFSVDILRGRAKSSSE